MLDYIYTNIVISRMDIRKIKNRLAKQAKFNKRTKTIFMLMAAWMAAEMIYDYLTDQQIKELQREIEELKSAKGE